ncbi:probable glutamate receptor [Haliotis rufescens]|uniref:probable glutamate receptor n=1 Tax=Haliotis rufescens TaxID=6454 RepID=UPI001EAFC8F0|nr:probable glutamate receptor [Haliotis rufescens]
MLSPLFLGILVQCVSTVQQVTQTRWNTGTNPPETDCHTMAAVSNIISMEKMETVYIIYDGEQDTCLYKLTGNLTHRTKVQFMGEDTFQDDLTSVIDDLVQHGNIDMMRRTLNVVLSCSARCIQQALVTGLELDMKVGKQSVLRHFSKWILIPNDNTGIAVTNLTMDNVILLTDNKNTTIKEVATLLWAKEGRQWDILDRGSTISLNNSTVYPNTRFGLNGRKLIVVALEWKPFSVKERDSGIVTYSGISGEYMDYLSKSFNFSYKYIEPPDKLWGHKTEDGNWTGIVGLLQREEADMCSVPYAFNIERAEVMEFTYPVLMEYSTVIYKTSQDESKIWKVLISCFKWEVYIVGVVVMLTVGLLHVCLLKSTPDPSKDGRIMKNSVSSGGLLMGIMPPLNQASVDIPMFDSGRMLFSCWWLFCLIMTAIYRGNLMAFLTVSRTVVPFRTLEELANQDVYDIGAPVGSYLSLAIMSSNQTTLKKIWKKIQQTHAVGPKSGDADYVYQLQRLHEGYFAYMQSNVASDVIMNGTCSLAKMKEAFLPTVSSMTFPLHSPMARLFHSKVLSVMDTGLYPKWYGKWVPTQESCSDKSIDVGVSTLHVHDYYSALAACAVGVSVASMVLLGETYLFQIMPRRNIASLTDT